MKKETPKTTAEVVYIKRESHLGYKAFAATITDGKVTAETPLMNSPDLESVAIEAALTHLEENLR